MALFDLHTIHAIRNGWPRFRDSLAAFQALFPGVAGATTTAWHTALVATPPTVRAAYAPGTAEAYPLIAVEMGAESVTQRFLGNSLGIEANVRRLGFFVSNTATVTIMAKQDEILRALHVVVRAIMLLAVPSFASAGYQDVLYQGSDALTPDEQAVAESMGIYVRRLTFSASYEVDIPEQLPGDEVPRLAWSVQDALVTEDPDREPATGAGAPGGVTPQT